MHKVQITKGSLFSGIVCQSLHSVRNTVYVVNISQKFCRMKIAGW